MTKLYLIILIIILSVTSTVSVAARDNGLKSALEIKPWSQELPVLLIDLPDGWKHEYRRGPDFDLYYASDKFGSITIGVYLGLHPNIGKVKAKKIKAFFPSIKKKATWLTWEKKKGEDMVFYREALINGLYSNAKKINDGDMRRLVKKMKFHIFLTAKTEDGMTKAVNMASSMYFE